MNEHTHDSRCASCRPAQRRSHRKSRNGCRNCKIRKVKCDENRPSCNKCSQSSIPCDFSPNSSEIANIPINRSNLKRRGRPLKTWTATFSDRNEPHNIEPILPKSGPAVRFLPPLNVEYMQLFFHYMTHASLTLGDDVLWRDKVPVLAFENPFVLRLMLAFSAMHLTRMEHVSPTEIARYEQLGEDNFSAAVREVTYLLPMINDQNCSALYIGTVLICNFIFAKPQSADHLLVVADDDQVAWWTLFRGVRYVLEKTSLEAIFSNHIGPWPRETIINPPSLQSQMTTGYIPWEEHLASLSTLIHGQHNEPEMDTNTLEVIHQGLIDCFQGVYGTCDNPEAITNGKMHVVIRWLWLLDDNLIDRIKRNDPTALVLLAHFTVILQTLECYWFMEGWAVHVMSGIVERLHPAYQGWVTWPRKQVG